MTNNRGFTLMEVLSVIIIIALIGVIVVPTVINTINKSKLDAYNNQVDTIKDGARLWSNDHISELSQTQTTYVTLEELLEKKYIEKEKMLDPRTNDEMNGCVAISYSNNKYNFAYDENYCSSALKYCVGANVTLIDNSSWHVLVSSNRNDRNIDLISDYFYKSDGTQDTTNATTFAFDATGISDYKSSAIYSFIKNDFTTALKTQITNAGGNSLNTIINIPSLNVLNFLGCTTSGCPEGYTWIKNGTSYWLQNSDLDNIGKVFIYSDSGISSVLPTASYGLRPIITTLKENIISGTSC